MISTLRLMTFVLFWNLSAPEANAAGKCDLVRSKRSHPDYIVGMGEGRSYKEAKLEALADISKIFGIDLSSKVTITESLQGGSLLSESVSQLSQESKGAEVLETCELGGSSFTVIMGVKKSLLGLLLSERARLRANTAATGEMTKFQIKKAKEAEAKDRENWLILGFRTSDFLVTSFPEPKNPIGPYAIKVDDEVARATLPLLLARLEQTGIAVSSTGNEITWSCLVASGTAVGNVVRFEVTCIVGDDILPAISAKGMARPTEEHQQAVRLVSKKLLDQTLTH